MGIDSGNGGKRVRYIINVSKEPNEAAKAGFAAKGGNSHGFPVLTGYAAEMANAMEQDARKVGDVNTDCRLSALMFPAFSKLVLGNGGF